MIRHEFGTCSPQLRHRHPFSNHSCSCSSLIAITLPSCAVQCTAHSSNTTTAHRQSPLNSRAFQTRRSSGIPPCPLLVKQVLKLNAHGCCCQDPITHTQQVSQENYQENLNSVFLQSGENTACGDRSLDLIYWCFHSSSLLFHLATRTSLFVRVAHN